MPSRGAWVPTRPGTLSLSKTSQAAWKQRLLWPLPLRHLLSVPSRTFLASHTAAAPSKDSAGFLEIRANCSLNDLTVAKKSQELKLAQSLCGCMLGCLLRRGEDSPGPETCRGCPQISKGPVSGYPPCLHRTKSVSLGEANEYKTKPYGGFLKVFPLEICQTSCA